MTADAHRASQFYTTPRGTVACGLVRERLLRAWPSLAGLAILGLGYASPYLRCWPDAARRIAAIPAEPGAPAPPATTPAAACLVDETRPPPPRP